MDSELTGAPRTAWRRRSERPAAPGRPGFFRPETFFLVVLFSASPTFAAGQEQFDSTIEVSSDAPNHEERAVFDPDVRPSQAFQVNPYLSLGGKLDIPIKGNRNRDLDATLSDNVLAIEPELTVFGVYQPASGISLVGEVRSTYLFPLWDDVGREEEGYNFDLGETYLLWPNPSQRSITLQIGRQRFRDYREWWYDEELDALRASFKYDRFSLDLSVAARLIHAEGDTRTSFLASGSCRFTRNEEFVFHAISRRDREAPMYRPDWYGFSWRGKPYRGQKVWVDLGVIRGEKDSETLRGTAGDAGWIVRFDHPLKPSLTLAYAYGSGDVNPDDGVNQNYRQTGLQDNNGVFGGITKFKYYGEALNPELSNLSIWTGGLGVRPDGAFSFDFVYHRYHQPEKDDHARFKIKQSPTGMNQEIGQEVDIIVGKKVTEKIRASLSAGLFKPGSAYIQRDYASSVELDFQYTF